MFVVTVKICGLGVLAQHQVVAPVVVLRIACGLRQNRVVVEQHACRTAGEARGAAGEVVGDVADPVDRARRAPAGCRSACDG